MNDEGAPTDAKRSPWWSMLIGTGVVLGGIALGFGTAAAVLLAGASGSVRSGAWTTDLTSGSTASGMYQRARVAFAGLFALSKEETLYWVAFEDDEDDALNGSCDYRVEGTELPARWWSITAYGVDSFLIPNAQQRYSFSMTTVEREPNGRFAILVSSDLKSRTKTGYPWRQARASISPLACTTPSKRSTSSRAPPCCPPSPS